MPFLPPELVELIVNELSAFDSRTFSTIALASHHFRILALRNRFKKCTIYVSSAGRVDQLARVIALKQLARIVTLEQIITSPLWRDQERVSQHIQNLKVEFELCEDAKTVRHSLINGRKCDFLQITSQLPDIIKALHGACVRSNLSYLSIYGIENIPPFICSSPYIAELSLKLTSFTPVSLEDDVALCKLPPGAESNALVPLCNLQSLTYDSKAGLIETFFAQHPLHRLANLTLNCSYYGRDKLFVDFNRFSDALTTLSIDLGNVYPETHFQTGALKYNLFSKLSLLTIRATKLCGVHLSESPTLFSCIIPLLPPHPNRQLSINLILKAVIYSEYGYANSNQEALLKCFPTLGEREVVRYWEGIQLLHTDIAHTGPALNVSFNFLITPWGPSRFTHSRLNDQDFAYLISLFDRLRNTKGVSLTLK